MISIPTSLVTPMYINKCVESMVARHSPSNYSFPDGRGGFVAYNDNIDGKVYAHPGYYKAMWLAQNGDIRIGEDGEQLYIRVFTIDGPTENWKPFDNVSVEFNIPKAKHEYGWTNAIRYVAQQNGLVVKRGIRIGKRAWWTESDGTDAHIEAHNVGDKYAFEMYIDPKNVKAEQVEQARRFMQWLTADQHSYENLQAMWATPFLESYKHLGYILYGEGGNGKGILLERGLMGQFKREAHVVKASALASSSKFEAGQEITRLAGAWWAIDPESATISEPVFETLKSICTGSTLIGRAIGQNAITVNNRSTLVIATNMPVSTPRTSAFDRRIAIIRMVDGRKPSDFCDLIRFIDTYGVTPFIIASCQFWENAVNNRDDWNDPWTDVSAGNELDLDDMEQYIVDKIMDDGRVLIADIRHEFHVTRISRETKDKLGLESVVSNSKRYLAVGDRNRFNAYVNEDDYADDRPDDFEQDDQPNTDYTPLADMLASDPKPLSQPGEGYSIVPAGQKKDQPKVAINWKRNYENHVEGDPEKPHAIVPDEQHMVIDMDTPKTGGEHGWDTLNREAGPLPETYTVRTPHDGIHLYYRIPTQWQGLMKSASHQHGLNVDVKAEAKGYVIGAGTHTADGYYTLINDAAVAEATPRMMRWLADHGYTSGRPTRILNRDTDTRNGDPDMSPVPEGMRNDTLYRWAFGRYHNHPEERDRVRDELFQRGHDSGLTDSELETIWNSVRNNA